MKMDQSLISLCHDVMYMRSLGLGRLFKANPVLTNFSLCSALNLNNSLTILCDYLGEGQSIGSGGSEPIPSGKDSSETLIEVL